MGLWVWGYPVCLVTTRKLTDNIIYRINKFVKNKVKLFNIYVTAMIEKRKLAELKPICI